MEYVVDLFDKRIEDDDEAFIEREWVEAGSVDEAIALVRQPLGAEADRYDFAAAPVPPGAEEVDPLPRPPRR